MKLKQLEEKIEAEFKKLEEKVRDLVMGEKSIDEDALSTAIADAKTATQQVATDHVQEAVSDATGGTPANGQG